MFHIMFVHYTLSSFLLLMVTFWEIAAHSPTLAICSHFGFKNEIWLMIAPVPVHCLPITFDILTFTSKQDK